MAFTIYGRASTNETSTKELIHLASFLRPSIGSRLNLPHQLVKTLIHWSNNSSKQHFVCGGLITQIAVWKCGYTPIPMDRPITLLNTSHLEYSRWLDVSHSGKWRLEKGVYVILPSEFTPALVPNRSDYLYPSTAYYSRPIECYPPDRPGPDPYAAGPSTSSSQYHYREESFSHTTTPSGTGTEPWQQVMTQIGSLQESLGRMQLDHQRAMYPIYDDYYRMGKIPQDHVHPTWYQPPPFAGDTSGAGYSGGAGDYDQGDEGDEDDEDDEILLDSD